MSLGLASLPSIITMLFDLLIGLLIYRRNPSSRSAIAYLFLASTFALWLGSAAIQRATTDELAIFFDQLQYAGASLIIASFTLFSYEFLINSNTILDYRYLRWTIYIIGIIFALLSFSGLLITNDVQKGTYDILGGSYTIYYGAFGPLYTAFVLVFVVGIFLNILAYLQSLISEQSKNRKKGIILVLSGLLLVGTLGTITDVILPLFGIRMPMADILTIIETGFIAIAMVKYKIFSIGSIPSDKRTRSSKDIEWGSVAIIPIQKGNEHIEYFNKLLKSGNWGIVITSRNPEDIKDSIIRKNIPIFWVTDEEVDAPHLNPTQLAELRDALNLFLKTTPNCIILLDQPEMNFGKSLVSSKNLWDILTYFKSLEAFLKKNENLLIFPITRTGDVSKEEDKIITVRKESWLSIPGLLALFQRIAVAQPIMENYSPDEQEKFAQCFDSQTNGRYELVKKGEHWSIEGPAPKNKRNLVFILRVLESCTKLVGKKEVTSALRDLLSSIGINEVDLLFHPGGSYLLLDSSPSKAYDYLFELGKKSHSLCITKISPDKVRRKFNIPKDCEVVWLSKNPRDHKIEESSGRAINTGLEYVYLEASNFIEKGPPGIIFMDVFEYLYSQNGFAPVMRMLEKVVDKVAITEHVFLMPVNPEFIKSEELILLGKIMEET